MYQSNPIVSAIARMTLLIAAGLAILPAVRALADQSATPAATPAKVMMWADRGVLTPSQVFFGAGGGSTDNPVSRLPTPPFSNFEADEKPNAYSPKCYITDANGVKWTAKFGVEVHPDVAASRLEWALGFGADEGYFVPGGVVQGMTASTKRGKAGAQIKADGTFPISRFKRHPEHHVSDAKGNAVFWDESQNPGVPQQQVSGILMLDVMVYNWDAQPKNCEILHTETPDGPENWYIVSDCGQSFGGFKSAWKVAQYQSEPFVQSVDANYVHLNFQDALTKQNNAHQQIPIADARWFRTILDRLTDDDIRAAFNAAVATPELIQAYADNDVAKADSLTSADANSFAAAFRHRITELDTKIPAAD